jgi:hypothetical protein
MKLGRKLYRSALACLAVVALTSMPAWAQQQKRPNIVMLMTDGYRME